jgi:hypothetical protein
VRTAPICQEKRSDVRISARLGARAGLAAARAGCSARVRECTAPFMRWVQLCAGSSAGSPRHGAVPIWY